MFTEALNSIVVQSVGLGLVLSLLSSEILGLAAGGMVVPGYVALMMHEPWRVVGTIVVALATYAVLSGVKQFTFIYGRRRIVFTVLIGFVLGWVSRNYFEIHTAGFDLEFHTIGLIIPGLIANWMDRQGVVSTLSMLIIMSTFVRLILVVATGGDVGLNSSVLL